MNRLALVSALLAGLTLAPYAAALEVGDRGFAKTAIRGTELEEIPVRFLGTWQDFAGPGLDLYLVELEGPRAETIGVAAGMSGSPVYIDGEMIGALSYRFGALPTRAVAGVTPLRDVLDAARSAGGSAAVDEDARPIVTPVSVSGVDPVVRAWLAEQLEPAGLMLTGGGRLDADDAAHLPTLKPGSPVGAQLVRGDASLAATGTVTWVDGARVWAFGHPFLGEGSVELPMVAADVLHTLADLAGSRRLANVGAEVGAFVDDRLSAIVGRTDRRAATMPLTVDVTGQTEPGRRFSYEIALHEDLLPPLAASMVATSLRANNAYSPDSTLRVHGVARYEGLPDLALEMAVAGGPGLPDPGIAVAGRLFETLAALGSNRFVEPRPIALELAVEVLPRAQRYAVESIHFDRGRLEPGAPLVVRCRLSAFRGEILERVLELELPATLPGSAPLYVAVGNASSIDRVMGNPWGRRLATATDASTIVEILGARPSDDRLTAVVYSTTGSVVSRGLQFPDLPPSARHLLGKNPGPAGSDRGRRVTEISRVELPMDGPVVGGQQRRLRVERDGHSSGVSR